MIYKPTTLVLVLVIAGLGYPEISRAQMFSVEEPEVRTRPSTSSLSFGADFMNMNLRPEGNDISTVYEITDPVYRIRLELPGIEAYAGYRTNIGDSEAAADTTNYLNIGANISGAMPVTGSKRVGITLPLWLSTDYTRVRSTDANQPESDQFRQSAVSIGIGAGTFWNLSDNIRFRAELVPQIGFTVVSVGSDSGQLRSLNGRVRMQFDRILGRYGLVAGYNYQWNRYSGAEERYHYDISSNNFSIGISF